MREAPAASARNALFATAALLALLLVGKSMAGFVPHGAELVSAAAVSAQLFLPLWIIQRRGEQPEAYGLHSHGALLFPFVSARRALVVWRRRQGPVRRRALAARGAAACARWLSPYAHGLRLDVHALGRDLARALRLCLLTFPPFGIACWCWESWRAPIGVSVTWAFSLPPEFLALVVSHLLLVALPEETFYRGFLEGSLDKLWPTRRFVLGIPLSRTVVVASFLFALGHFVGEWNPLRFGPFFPAFLFSMLTRRGRSIAGAVVYHGFSNVFSQVLFHGFVVHGAMSR